MWDYDAYINRFSSSVFSRWNALDPWELTAQSNEIVLALLSELSAEFRIDNEIAIHESATVEDCAVLKGPLIVGAGCFIAAGAYLRGGCWLEAGNIIGPGCELKSSLVFEGTKLAHFNFVGDSILGSRCNLEAGSIVANYRNEQNDRKIQMQHRGTLIETNAEKFGVLAGDHTRIGANAVIAPGAILERGSIVRRLSLIDQSPCQS